MAGGRSALLKFFVDAIIILIVGIPVFLFYKVGQPKQRGFFCDDNTIRYPFHDSTVTNIALYTVGVLLPVTVICITEITNNVRSKRDRSRVFIIHGHTIPYIITKIWCRLSVFLFGACVSQLTTDIAKYSIGRLRPHFMDVCKPIVDCPYDSHKYIEEFQCQETNVERIREARLSFPSGHSSFSAYAMFYTVLYLQACMRCNGNRLLRPFVQFLLLATTWFTALSRVADYKHHWSDVLVGFLLGIIVALVVFFFVSDCFKREKKEPEDISLQNMSTSAQIYNSMDVESQTPNVN